MEIYRVCTQYNRGISKVIIDKVNPDGWFFYRGNKYYHVTAKKINNVDNKEHNESCFFLTYEEAKEHLIKRATLDIEKAKNIIKKAENTIKNL